jgi:hypothetical protein
LVGDCFDFFCVGGLRKNFGKIQRKNSEEKFGGKILEKFWKNSEEKSEEKFEEKI